jgi:glycosyltransferase involved in cell wall biosynthesis
LEKIKAIDVVGSGWPEHYNSIHPKLHFLGFVDSLKDAICGSLLIVPILTGSGMRMKILDAAAMGVPFITTSVGVEGLDFLHNDSCIIANNPEDIANAINKLIADNTKMKALADNAQEIFKKKYSVEALSEIRNNIYKKLAN